MNHEDYIDEILRVIVLLKEMEVPITKAADKIIENYSAGGVLLVCGNGGSAADAQHLVAEHIGAYMDRDRKSFPAIDLSSNTSNLTAVSNDFGYAEVFARQLDAFDRIGYVLIGISTSGNSKNVNRAIEKAKEQGHFTIGLSGKEGGRLSEIADLCITVPDTNMTPVVQTAHNIIYHRICELVEKGYKHG